ncbi:siderophore-interacting protein [Croceibacterium sp. TMG7-5b_MA50]|uniref:siderophore-interacting protein n=1 Tax=Croceibacterium sp. TMG7-5b_MA50 TaxID=3121290 RepID=UPI003221AC83
MSKRLLTPNMLRVTLGGAGLAGFPAGQAGGYLKLRVPAQGGGKPCVRTYTISAQGQDGLEVDFALHADAHGKAGPATAWALGTDVGDVLEVGGPGAAKPLPAGHDFYLVAGDMTSLPAISVNLAALPDNARGLAVIEISDTADRQDLPCPAGVELAWLVKQPGSDPDLLARTLRSRPWPQGSVYAWAACEFAAMRALRTYLRDERGLMPDRLYISSYWQAGSTEDRHREVKRADAEGAV